MGQAGKPKTITGFQTHKTPVLLAYGERAELATEECILHQATPTLWPSSVATYIVHTCILLDCFLDPLPDIPLTPILEGFVILKKNLDYEQ